MRTFHNISLLVTRDTPPPKTKTDQNEKEKEKNQKWKQRLVDDLRILVDGYEKMIMIMMTEGAGNFSRLDVGSGKLEKKRSLAEFKRTFQILNLTIK